MKAVFLSLIGGKKTKHTLQKTNKPSKKKPLSQQQIRYSIKFLSPYHKLYICQYVISVYPLQADPLTLFLCFSSCYLWWSLWCFFYDLEVPQRFFPLSHSCPLIFISQEYLSSWCCRSLLWLCLGTLPSGIHIEVVLGCPRGMLVKPLQFKQKP